MDETSYERAARFEGMEREHGIRKAQAALAGDPLPGTANLPGGRTCLDCGHAIEARRIEAMPSAVRCIACATETERPK